MKKLLALTLLLLSGLASAANGPWDGIYDCNISAGGVVQRSYVTVNGQPNGHSIWALAATSGINTFYGYGIGHVVGDNFSGTTSFHQPFSINADSVGFSGKVGVVVNSRVFVAEVTCTKVY